MKKLLAGLLIILLCLIPVSAESPEEQEKQILGYVALTFDDGPSGALTEQLLDGLAQRNARATFFLCGYRMERYPDVMSRYLEEGHEIGVHSTVHADLTTLSKEAVHQDMEQTAQRIYELTGVRPVVMRPPGGAYNEMVQQEAKDEGMSVILWSLDPKDWASHSASAVLQTMTRHATAGDIILMHDMSGSSVSAALGLVDNLQQRGYCFVTVSELAKLSGVEPRPGVVYKHFRTQGN